MMTTTLPSLFDHFFADFDRATAGPRASAYTPAVDLYEHEDRIELSADLPGLTDKDISVHFEDRVLTISGERKADPDSDGRRLRRERRAGSFERAFVLDFDVDVEAIEARVRDGVLRVKLPKAKSAQRREIPVTVN